MASGVNVSKANVYTVTTQPQGVDVMKANLYAVVFDNTGVNVRKANVYAVIKPAPTDKSYLINFL